MTPHFKLGRRVGIQTAACLLALALSSCSSSEGGTDQKSSAPEYDTAAVGAGAGWLSRQVSDGVVHNDQYDIDDYGLSVDIALALQAVDAQGDAVRAVADRLATDLDGYVAPGYGTLTSAGSTAKAVVLAEAVGDDPTSFGRTDLVARLEDTVANRGPVSGRAQDELDPKEKNAADYANVVAQAYAVLGLAGADSDEAQAATDFLLQQQCSEGWFRLDFTADTAAPDQGCDADPDSAPDIDATAFAVRALLGQDDPAASTATEKAVTWLQDVQAADGSLGGAPVGKTPNSNSTGLAGWVLGEAGQTAAAGRAASWVAAYQLPACPSHNGDDVGAIAYDDTALAAVGKKGITVKAQDQFRRASAQTLPVLQWLAAEDAVAAEAAC